MKNLLSLIALLTVLNVTTVNATMMDLDTITMAEYTDCLDELDAQYGDTDISIIDLNEMKDECKEMILGSK